MDECYGADGCHVFFDAGTTKAPIAEATSEEWARHIAAALNRWDT
jgi:hypothetical protein